MAIRMRWNIEEESWTRNRDLHVPSDRERICELVDANALAIHFQAIYSVSERQPYGFEALTRIRAENPFFSIDELFQKAVATGVISALDMQCRENAFEAAAGLGLTKKGCRLFLNFCPETLLYPAHRAGLTDQLAEKWSIPKESIILEITEQEAIRNYGLFKQSIEHYRERGYQIAIDDFGAGYGGLKMLSIIEPDFVKIDRHFISDIDKSIVKHNLVDSIATACHRIGIKVIAEGVEQAEELKVILDMGIDLVQGFLLHRPSASPPEGRPAFPASHSSLPIPNEQMVIGDLARPVEPIRPDEQVMHAFQRFIDDPSLRGLPVVDEGRVCGMLGRWRFLENRMLGRFGYGFALNSYKTVEGILGPNFLLVAASSPLEEVARKIGTRREEHLYDDICIDKCGKYLGTVPVSALLDAMTERSLSQARGTNPLSGLPGNEFIQSQIQKLLTQNMHFDVCYLDIDHFKPFNDCCGFEKGDQVIRRLGEIAVAALQGQNGGGFGFVGHIGGDDFILVCRPRHSIPICEQIVREFEAVRPLFHNPETMAACGYLAEGREGEERFFGLLSLSIGIVSTEVHRAGSVAEIASLASEVKKAAKMQKGSTIVRDRRLNG